MQRPDVRAPNCAAPPHEDTRRTLRRPQNRFSYTRERTYDEASFLVLRHRTRSRTNGAAPTTPCWSCARGFGAVVGQNEGALHTSTAAPRTRTAPE